MDDELDVDDDDTPTEAWGELEVPSNSTSEVWKHFKRFSKMKCRSKCNHCGDIMKIKRSNTSHMYNHYSSAHGILMKKDNQLAADQRLEASLSSSSSARKRTHQQTIDKFTHSCPGFEDALINWMGDSYQPLQTVTRPSFRAMLETLNPRVPAIGKDALKKLVREKAADVRAVIKNVLKDVSPATITCDGWTSKGKDSYFGVTVHYINQNWELCSAPASISKKHGRSQAEDYVRELESVLENINYGYEDVNVVVSDTEPTMVAFGRHMTQAATDAGADTKWHGCIDHILNLITKRAFRDSPETETYEGSDGAMDR